MTMGIELNGLVVNVFTASIVRRQSTSLDGGEFRGMGSDGVRGEGGDVGIGR
jgi:hypothetical protein